MAGRRDVEDARADFVDGVTAGFPGHEGDDIRLVHEPQLAVRPVLVGIGMVDDRRVHEQAAVRE